MKTATAPLPPLRSGQGSGPVACAYATCITAYQPNRLMSTGFDAFIRFHGVRHPATLGSKAKSAFLSWLANERKVQVSTHRQALGALLFFYGKVLCTDARPGFRRSEDLSRRGACRWCWTPDEVVRILGFLEGEHRLFAQLLYGTGMRISEGLQLRVKDLDFDHGTIIVRGGQELQGSGL